ncbi:MAG TPA: PKD domain-containing protein, partial [Methanoregulaceae archaeon]|nr:PKD domain-containing protein [Methanoregulaceae archaeon]
VVWQDHRDQNFDIYLYNITTGLETLITPDTPGSDQMHPAIYANYIVWDDNRDQTYGNENIFMFNLEGKITSKITGNIPASLNIKPKIFGNRVVWTGRQNGVASDIYMFTLGPVQTPLVSDFSVNVTKGIVPFTVKFTGKSTGNPSSWRWDFGDGNTSTEQNPVYTYNEAGQFSPSLTVSNPYSRDSTTKENLITAGTAPCTKFSMSPSSGPAPLNVTFTDLSSGYPDTWNWNFGDNSTSGDESPSHVYTNPGNYTVALTTANEFGNNTIEEHINVINSTVDLSSYAIPGLVQYLPDTGFIEIDTTNESDYSFDLGENNTRLAILSKNVGILPSFVLISGENDSFSKKDSIISGNITDLIIKSGDITSPGFTDEIGKQSWVNYSFEVAGWDPNCSLETIIYNDISPEERQYDNNLVQLADFGDFISGIAYATQCVKTNISHTNPATITMSVSHSWVLRNSQYNSQQDRFTIGTKDANGNFIPYNTQFKFSDTANNLDYYTVNNDTAFNFSSLFIKQYNASLSLADSQMKIIDPADPGIFYGNSIVIAVDSDWVRWNDPGIWDTLYEPVTILHVDDNGNGEVLNTTHLYYDPEKDLDVFTADSPHGLSEFTLVSVGKYTNPLQLLYLSILSRVSPATTSAPKPKAAPPSYGGGGGGSGSYGGSGNTVTSSSPAEPAAPVAATASGPGSAGAQQSQEIVNSPAQEHSVQQPASPSGPVVTNNVLPSKTQPGANVGGIVVPIPNSSVFSMFIETAAMISVVLIVVFSTYTRYRRKEKD